MARERRPRAGYFVRCEPPTESKSSDRALVSTAISREGKVFPVKARIRQLLRAEPFQPFIIRITDGREYRVRHPDFVLAASSDIPQITIEEEDGRQHYLSALLVTSVERIGPVGVETGDRQG